MTTAASGWTTRPDEQATSHAVSAAVTSFGVPTAPSRPRFLDRRGSPLNSESPPRMSNGRRLQISAPKETRYHADPRASPNHRIRANAVIGLAKAAIRNGEPSARARSATHGRKRDRLSADPKFRHDVGQPTLRRRFQPRVEYSTEINRMSWLAAGQAVGPYVRRTAASMPRRPLQQVRNRPITSPGRAAQPAGVSSPPSQRSRFPANTVTSPRRD